MIKHRFILRGADDFRVFAAIPVERTVLTWKKWVRPLDWAALEALLQQVQEILTNQTELWTVIADRYADMAEARGKALRQETVTDLRDVSAFNTQLIAYQKQATRVLERSEWFSRVRSESVQRLLHLVPVRSPETFPGICADVARLSANGIAMLVALDDEAAQAAVMVRENEQRIAHMLRTQGNSPHTARQDAVSLSRMTMQATIKEAYDKISKAPWSRVAETAVALISSDPVDTITCPEGIPFAAYTIECADHSTVNVIEGQAWIDAGEPTDEEKRVADIVTQMLTERAINPKADTRIPVAEIDPAHAHKTRAAEERDKKSPPPTTQLRTIKFNVSPPRYLRQAAERILASSRRAHWVIGHWRDQAYGEGMKLRRQTWIKPHIRGLGEAGAITARVAAPDEEIAKG